MSENEKLREALVQHNDRLRSAMQIALRDGADTDWLAFRGQCQYTLAKYHDIVNDAREALSTPPSKADADDVEQKLAAAEARLAEAVETIKSIELALMRGDHAEAMGLVGQFQETERG